MKENEKVVRIGILATGNEIINGDVLNSNGPFLSRLLRQHNFQPGLQITVDDDQTRLEQNLQRLLDEHDVVVTIGGLGPTSDDRTRFALSNVVEQELVFRPECWEKIVKRLTGLGLDVPENNRQQCLFPEKAEILSNAIGTADGCYLAHQGKALFMLPGPPREFQPLVEEQLISRLINHYQPTPLHFCRWMTLGMGEGQIAKQLDPLWQNEACYVGYRAEAPYVEVKLESHHVDTFKKIQQQFDQQLNAYAIPKGHQSASAALCQLIVERGLNLHLDDQATHSHLAATLTTPETLPYFNSSGCHIMLTGFDEFWQQDRTAQQSEVQVYVDNQPIATVSIPLQRRYTLRYGIEIICKTLFTFLFAR